MHIENPETYRVSTLMTLLHIGRKEAVALKSGKPLPKVMPKLDEKKREDKGEDD